MSQEGIFVSVVITVKGDQFQVSFVSSTDTVSPQKFQVSAVGIEGQALTVLTRRKMQRMFFAL